MSPYELQTPAGIEAALCKRLEATRLSKNITQADLAARAGISRRTVTRMENGEGVSLETFIRVLRALGLAENLATLVPEQTVSPIERVNRSKPNARIRASRKPKPASTPEPWKWGES